MRPPGGWQRFSLILLALLALNFLFASLVPNQRDRVEVPYTYFRDQVEAGNVNEVTTTGDAIQGAFNAPPPPRRQGHAQPTSPPSARASATTT